MSLAVNGTPGSLVKTSKMKYRVVRANGVTNTPTANQGNTTATPDLDSRCIPGVVCQRSEKIEYVGALHEVGKWVRQHDRTGIGTPTFRVSRSQLESSSGRRWEVFVPT